MAFEDNRVAYWRLDESSGNAVDSSGNSNTEVNQNSTPFAAGKVNNGANFVRANNNFFTLVNANQTGLDITGDISFSFWVKITSQPSSNDGYYFISKWNEPLSQRKFALYYWNNDGVCGLRFAVPNDAAGSGANDLYFYPLTLTNGIVFHIAASWDASAHEMRYYVNGSLVNVNLGVQGYTSMPSSTAPLNLGAYNDSENPNGLRLLDGMLDEVMIWSRVLTPFEIRNYYNLIQIPKIPMPTFFNL